jgi:signal transduction histidine kinase
VLRRALLIVPVLAVGAVLLGVALPARPLLGAVVAALVGFAVALALVRAADARVARVTERLARFAEGDTTVPLEERGGREWRRLSAGLNAVGAALERRFEQLAAERRSVERLLDDLPVAVLLFREDALSYANREARAQFGVDRAEARTPRQVLGIEALAGAVREASAVGKSIEVEVTRDDRCVLGRASRSGEQVMLVVSDVTEVRRVEQIRRDFVTNASHELKTPAAGMQALSESLAVAVERDPQRARRMVALLQREAGRLAQLVRELLDLARLEEAAGTSGRQRVDLRAFVAAEVERLAPLARERGVEMRCEGTAAVPLVAVPEDLRLIVANLLENAVQYNRTGGQVVATAERSDGIAVLKVADTGIGIADAHRDRIFERFYRVDKARSRAAGGTGLGLSIVRHAAQRQGGDVSVDSVLGEGSTFKVVLPVEGSRDD